MTVMHTTCLTPSEATETVLRRYRQSGGRRRGMAITEVEHAAQCAMLARRAGLEPSLVAACLLHDYGRLLGADPGEHAELGAEALEAVFGPEVTEPIRLHSRAWGYLAAVEPDFALAFPARPIDLPAELAEPMSGSEVKAFLREPWASSAATLRRIDESGRLPGVDTPPLEHFRPLLEGLVERHLMIGG